MGDARHDTRKTQNKDDDLTSSVYSTRKETIDKYKKKSSVAQHKQTGRNDAFKRARDTIQSPSISPHTSDIASSFAVLVNKTGERCVRSTYTPKVGAEDSSSLTKTAYARPKSSKQVENRVAVVKPSDLKNLFVDMKSPKEQKHVIDSHNDHVVPIAGSWTLQNKSTKTKTIDPIERRPTGAKNAVADTGFIQTTKDSELTSPRSIQDLPSTPHKTSVQVRPKTNQTVKDQSAGSKPTGPKGIQQRSVVHHEPAATRPKNSPKANSATADPGMIIIIMNVKGAEHTSPWERRKCIANTVKRRKPKLLLFQEFVWKKGIDGTEWEDNPIPKHYQYFGNTEASVLYDVRDIVAIQLNSTELRRILENLQRTSNNAFNSPFPMDFDPLPRMCACTVSTIGVPFWEFICVSWHGPWNGWKLDRRKTYFQYLIEFLKKIITRFKRPLLIAGDFNIDFPDIEEFIKHPFKKYDYTPSERREGRVKDYFITSIDMNLTKMKYVDIGSFEDYLDHDPISSCLSEVVV